MAETLASVLPEVEAVIAANPEQYDQERLEFIRDLAAAAASGLRAWIAAIMCGLIVAYYVMWARLRAETGLGFLPFPLGAEDFILVPFGSSAMYSSRDV